MPASSLSSAQRAALSRAIDAAGGPVAYAESRRVSPVTLARALAGYRVYPATAHALLEGLEPAQGAAA